MIGSGCRTGPISSVEQKGGDHHTATLTKALGRRAGLYLGQPRRHRNPGHGGQRCV